MALHGGQCRVLLLKTSAIAQRAFLGPLPSTCGFMQSTRIAFPCFPRPRFELGLSSRVPQVSAKRARLSCPIRPRLLDHPSQRSQSWPVNTILIIAIRRMSDHRSYRRMRGIVSVLSRSLRKLSYVLLWDDSHHDIDSIDHEQTT